MEGTNLSNTDVEKVQKKGLVNLVAMSWGFSICCCWWYPMIFFFAAANVLSASTSTVVVPLGGNLTGSVTVTATVEGCEGDLALALQIYSILAIALGPAILTVGACIGICSRGGGGGGNGGSWVKKVLQISKVIQGVLTIGLCGWGWAVYMNVSSERCYNPDEDHEYASFNPVRTLYIANIMMTIGCIGEIFQSCQRLAKKDEVSPYQG